MIKTSSVKTSSGIDESLYSRQLYVLGHEGQKRMANASVLIIGCNGLGVEVAKNVILAGVKSVSIYDPIPATFSDLSCQFYLTESDVGTSRAQASIDKLSELNPYVHVSLVSPSSPNGLEELIRLNKYTVMVVIDQSLERQLKLGDIAHDMGTSVICADVKGVFGSVFCDFGDEFVVIDKDGEPNASSLVAGVVYDQSSLTAVITTLEETRHGLVTGDVVLISDIVGSVGTLLNGREYNVTVKDLYSFEITLVPYLSEIETLLSDSSKSGLYYERGGYVNQVKQPVSMSFERMSSSIDRPGIFLGDEYKLYRAGLMHVIFRSYHKFVSTYGYSPSAGNVSHAQTFYDLIVSLVGSNENSVASLVSVEELKDNEKLIKQFALTCVGNLSPVCAFFGGIVGQEVLKACSGKFTPIKQWLYYDFLDSLPDNILTEEEVKPLGTRYDGQIAIYGRSFQQQLQDLRLFLVGAGAIGCEVIKNYSLMGVGCHPSSNKSKGGCVYITDPDQIEKSNLSRQFLFRNTDIHTPKSSTAARAAIRMNNDMNITALEQKVCPETESFFNDLFYEDIDVICTALDNIEARLYVDQKALFYHKPMLESGTLGTKGHTQLVIPYLTEHYGATRDPPEKSIPMCTLKFFPNQIEHTIQWAREWFEETFQQTPNDALGYLNDPEYLSTVAKQHNVKLDTLTHIKDTLGQRPKSIEDCIVWARLKFEELFSHQIQQLLYNLPLDKVTAEGTPFWSGAKKPPSPLVFDLNDSEHLEFVLSAAWMRATVYGLTNLVPPQDDTSHYVKIAGGVVVSRFKPQDNVKIATTEEEAKNNGNNKITPSFAGTDIDQICNDIISNLPPREQVLSSISLHAIEFDKDIDDHMKVIASLANLRARNYRIPEVDLHKSRGIAGKIIPAIATTTALVTGAICMELYKLLLKKPVDSHYNSFFNLAIPLFTAMNPEPPKSSKSMIKGKEWKWNQWDRVDISEPNMTLAQLINHLEQTYEVDLVMLSAGVTIVFSAMLPAKKSNERKAMKIKDLVESICKKTMPSTQKYLVLEVMVEAQDSGEEVDMPYIRFQLQ